VSQFTQMQSESDQNSMMQRIQSQLQDEGDEFERHPFADPGFIDLSLKPSPM
jgi:hypothetical protein